MLLLIHCLMLLPLFASVLLLVLFFSAVLCVLSNFAIFFLCKRELIALL